MRHTNQRCNLRRGASRLWPVRLAIVVLLAAGTQAFFAPALQASAPSPWAFTVSGDFNGDGKADIAQFDSTTGQWWVRLSTGSSFTSSVWTTWNPAVRWVDVKVGDFNGDGKTDIAGRDASTGQWWVAISNGSSFSSSVWTTWDPAVTWVDVQVGDFDGDVNRITDIAGRDASTGKWWVAISNGSTSFTNSLWTTWNPLVTWVDVHVGDFNGDGKTDIAGRIASDGEWWVALSTGSSFTTSLWTTWDPAITWADVRVGDFNGDGKTDIAGRAVSTGDWQVALSTGSGFTNSVWTTWDPAFTWVDVKVGDFDGDVNRITDIAGRVASTGQWWVALSTGSSFVNSLWTTWDPAVKWGPVLVGDFDGDVNHESDIAGFDAAEGQWWVALSTGSSFSPKSVWATVTKIKRK